MSAQSQVVQEIDGYSLVGTGNSHYWCGIWQTFGCLNHKTAYVRQFKRTCFRSECKVCYIAWANRQANRTIQKLNRMKRNSTLHHSIITIPTTWDKKTKANLIRILKKIGVESACIIHTPFDETNQQKYYLKNTLHIFYYGKMVNMYISGDIQITQLDDPPKDDLFKLLQFQFLNCGVKKGTHPITWIGRTIYCTIQSEKSGVDGRNCPLCNKKLHLIYFDGKIPPIPPDEWYNGELDKSGWKYCWNESLWEKIVRKIKRKIMKFIIITRKHIYLGLLP